jgi:hypothetical protein
MLLDVVRADPNFKAWFGKDVPDDLSGGRYPTPDEIIEAVNKTNEYEIIIEDKPRWRITAQIPSTGRSVIIEATKFFVDTNKPVEIVGRRDRGELEKIITAFPKECGAFIVATDGEDPSLVISSGF